MVGWYEIVGERADPQQVGGIRLNTFYETRNKSLWLISLKSLALVLMIAAGFAVTVPWMPMALWKSSTLVAGIMLMYVGLAFFVRPEANEDNLGLLGGLVNDPLHYSDNLNRALWQAHCLLGPGRFAAGTVLDISTLLGFTAEVTAEQANEEDLEQLLESEAKQVDRWRREAMERVEQRQSEKPQGQLQLTSTQYLSPDRFDS
jgi:hypothetical protein